MYYVSYVTLLALLIYIVVVHQCDGHNIHTQRLRRSRQDWLPYSYLSSYPSYNDYSSKLRELQLLMEISERLGEIMSKLNQKQQQQPVYIPIYVPYFMPNNGYSVPYNGKGNFNRPDGEPILPTTARPLGDKPKPEDATTNKDQRLKVNLNTRNGITNTEDNGIESPQEAGSTESLKCEIATVACCRFSNIKEKENCFAFYKCSETYNIMLSCRTQAIDRAVTSITDTYAPKKRHTYT